MYDGQGNKTWDCTLDIYGKVLAVDKGTEFDCPFRFQGQYADEEIGLYYNRFRYYNPDIGMYVSQDPIGIFGGNPTLHGYVHDTNSWTDILGLEIIPNKAAGLERETIAKKWLQNQFPNAEILSERYLKYANGKSVYDVVTGSRRRVDFVVVENGKVIGVYEVTSSTADKSFQALKEERIKRRGGTYIKEPGKKGKLYDISNIKTTRLDVDLESKEVKYH